jgi:hypothetical protein
MSVTLRPFWPGTRFSKFGDAKWDTIDTSSAADQFGNGADASAGFPQELSSCSCLYGRQTVALRVSWAVR